MNTLTKTKPSNELLATQLDYILIDGSGSMSDKWFETLAAVDTYLDGLRAANLQAHTIVTTFDSVDHCCIHRDMELKDCPSFKSEPIGAHFAATPLFDAINTMARRLRELDPPRATILIVTDGLENASEYTDQTQAKALLDWCRAKGWQVIFMGADFNNSNQARALGANEDSAIGVQRRLLAVAASLLARKRAAYGHGADGIHFSKDEQQQFGGLLPAPPPGA